jgi:hypothetical protein
MHKTPNTKLSIAAAAKPTKAAQKKQNRLLKKAVHKTAKRRNHHAWSNNINQKVVIPVKREGPDDFLNLEPKVGQYFEDPQGVEPWALENRGTMNFTPEHNNQWRLMAGVTSEPFPEKIGITKQDTLYTYGRRVHRLEMKRWINALREMEDLRIERNFQIASRQAKEIQDRSRIYQAWRLRKKRMVQYNHTVRMQKHAAALAVSYARGQENEKQRLFKHAQTQKQYIELMMNERRTSWIEDHENISPTIFNTIEHPTGWWPNDDTRQLTYSKFDTDDHDIQKYFTTSFPPYTNIRPKKDGVHEYFDVIQNSEAGWKRENKALTEKIHRYVDLEAGKSKTKRIKSPQLELPSENEGEPELVSRQYARSGIRTRTFLLHTEMPNELHGVLRNIGSHSRVESPKYQQVHKGFDIDGDDAPLAYTVPAEEHVLKELRDANVPHSHRITL